KHLNTLGNCYWGMSNYVTALEYYKKAAKVMFQIGEKTEEVKYLGNCGLINWNFGNFKLAMEYYRKALIISREIGNITSEASTLRNIGYVHSRLNHYSKALSCYNQSLKIARSYSNKPLEVGYLADIANIHWMKGDYQRALEYNQRALRIFLNVENKNNVGNRYNESKALKGIGHIYWKIGDYAKALEYYIRALKVNRKRVNKEKESQILVDIGNIHNNIGDYSKALKYLKKTLEIQREIKVKSAEGVTLGNMGRVYLNQKKYSLSLKYFQKALKIAQEMGNKRNEGNRLVGIASVYLNLGDYQKSLKILNQSLKLAKETDNKDIEAFIFCKKGYLFNRLNNFSESLKCYYNALALGENLKSAKTIWDSYSGLGSLNEKQGKYKNALICYRKSIKVIEKMRSQLQIKEFKSGFLENKIKVYESTVNLLVKLHETQSEKEYDEESFYFVERAKARAFLDSLKESKTSISQSLSPELREEEHRIVKEISKIQTKLMKPGLSDSERKEFIKKLGTEEENYQHLILKIKSNNPEYANLVYPQFLKLEIIQKILLDKKSALMEYFIGEKNSFLFFLTRDNFSIHRLSEGNLIQDMVEDYIDLLANTEVRKFRAYAAGKKIYQELISPVKDKLVNFNKVIIVPDGNLHYLPFEALIIPDSSSKNKYLVEDLQISYAPSASSLLNLKKRKKELNPRMDFLAFADPVYTFKKKPGKEKKADWIFREFCLDQGFNLSPLQYSGEEVKQIAKLIKKENREIYTRQDAREENLKKITLSDFKIIHFATHGLFDEKIPQRSSIVLTLDEDPKEDGFFQVREIYNSKLNSDLVVLSACQTGKGKLEKGEGVSGLSRAFLYAGAQSVLVSLWNVNDKATSKFMEYLYKYLIAGKSKKEALQKAKIRMIRSKYNHPFYWAAFVLIGDGESSVKINKSSLLKD
ncbi:MAG: CHAT domain-containing protein, partial [Candidatus Aminicenantes bacterium]|nr:CHAT domain-containing protein [Candidatus Aminicenantes bacterium]